LNATAFSGNHLLALLRRARTLAALVIRMNFSSRKIVIVAGAGTGLLIARAALPVVLTWLANLGVRKIPGYRGSVRRVGVNFTDPSLVVRGLSLAKFNGSKPEQRLNITSVIVASEWKKIFAGELVGYIRIDSPRILLDLEGIRRKAGNGATKPNSDRNSTTDKSQQPWQEKVNQLPAFRLSSAIVTDGEVRLQGIPGQNGADIRIDRLNLSLENITNSTKIAPTLMAKASCKARVMSNGNLELRAEGYPLAQVATFNADFQTSNIDLTEVRTLIEKNAEIDVRRGIVGLYLEAAAADGQIHGYAKPIFDHLELEPAEHIRFAGKIKAWAAEAVANLGKNKPKDRIAMRLDFEGSLDDPELNLTDAILSFLHNSFVTAERASLEHRIWFSKAGRTADDVEIHDGTQPHSKAAVVFGLLKETFSRWSEDAAPRMAAALSYYTAFSMAPLLILAISIAGLVLGREAAQGKIVEQIGGLVGKQSATAIQSMIQAGNRPSKGILAAVIGIVSLLAGATGVLSELKSALNKIWRTQGRSDMKEIVKKDVVFVGMLLGMGFLLTVSLIVSAAISGLGKFLGGMLPAPELLLHIADFVLSFGIIAVLFAAIYRFLPNIRVEWRDVWVGAAVTSFLFYMGKLGLGLYIGKGAVGSAYGAAGSILVLLLWVYSSGLIFYFGAEFTKVYADRYGSRKMDKKPKTTGRHLAHAQNRKALASTVRGCVKGAVNPSRKNRKQVVSESPLHRCGASGE
jgi:membrane protein